LSSEYDLEKYGYVGDEADDPALEMIGDNAVLPLRLRLRWEAASSWLEYMGVDALVSEDERPASKLLSW